MHLSETQLFVCVIVTTSAYPLLLSIHVYIGQDIRFGQQAISVRSPLGELDRFG